MNVTYFQRRPQGSASHSIERLFAKVRSALPAGIIAKTFVSRFPSRGLFRRLYNIIEAAFNQGDVNHITGDVYFLALLMHRSHTVITYTDLVSLHRTKGLARAILKFFWYILPLRRAGTITAISEFTKRELVQEFALAPERIHVIHCPVVGGLRYVPKSFNEAEPTILQVGTDVHKNLSRVAEALAGMPCRLRIVGILSAAVEQRLRELELRYSFVQDIIDEDLAAEYSRCDMLVFASTYEGFGMPIIEAQAVGRPVVTSNVCSMPEVAGDGACLVDPYYIQSIRNGIFSVIRNKSYRDDLIAKGRKNVKRFNAVDISEAYAKLYTRVVSHNE